MTWPAALSGAALRMMRTAAGRRALQLGLLVGALFALGFLCGEQAHAADGVSTASSSGTVPPPSADGVRSLTSSAVGQVANTSAGLVGHGPATPQDKADLPPKGRDKSHLPITKGTPQNPGGSKPVSSTGPLLHPTSDQVLRPVTDAVVPPVTGRVVQPVGDLVGAVVDGLAEARTKVPPVPSLPGLPKQPGPPSLPLPGLPGLSELPGQLLPAPVTSAPRPQQPGDAPSAGGHAPGGRSRAAARTPEAVGHGPRFTAEDIWAGTTLPAHPTSRAAHTPAQQAPAGDPNGALGSQSTAETGTSRHGDAHAVTLHDRAPLRLVPGAAARVDAACTRDRHRDIPLFPG
ncbi:hypothetical protein ABZV31_10510 [Streptomyces sp. NPDC005202]|uniref:hypothetical protein n=1 Tax=Streptomyces sp. NPDC005202 TaxID=3157021 RepID=UPI0033A94E86